MKIKIRKFLQYLKEPYPYYYSDQKGLLKVLFLIAILSFAFSYFFEPFGVNVAEHRISYSWILFLHAFLPVPIAYGYLAILNSLIKSDIHWNLGKEIFHLSMILLLIGVVNFLIRDFIYIHIDNWSWYYFWTEIRNTFLVGFLLLMILIPVNLERLINEHSSRLKSLKNSSPNEITPSTVTIKSNIESENFELVVKDFLFAKVESNYTEIVISSSNGIEKNLIRITLKELEDQLREVKSIFKTHRSYLVNINAIASISGNAQGYQLRFQNLKTSVPVSRSNISNFNSFYRNASQR